MSQRSPKFFLREKTIAEIVNHSSLVSTWKKKTHTDFRNFFLTDLVDYLDVNISINDVCARIVSKIKAGEYSVSGTKRYTVEKSKGLCRQMTLPSVADALTLQCLADVFWKEIKSKSPSKNAFFEPKDHSFSRNDANEPEYGSVKAWLDFQRKILGFSQENKYIIVTDIANYYDFIDFGHLRNVVVSVATIREPIIGFPMYILSGMCWKPDYMPGREVGMPQIDIDAPRLLAHCFLFELDAVMEDMKFSNYARFMDDIDAGANNIAEAKKIIKSIDMTLQTRQLRLNSGKTRILTYKEARRHFRVLENRVLKKFEKKILVGNKEAAAKMLPKMVEKWSRRKVFDDGNGEKILKRVLSFSTSTKAKLDKAMVHEFIRLRPNIRKTGFRYLAHTGYDAGDFGAISKIIADGHVCDDAFRVDYSSSVLHGRIAADAKSAETLREFCNSLWSDDFYELYCGIILSSRFEHTGDTLKKLNDHVAKWRHDHHLGRIIGALAPVAMRDGCYAEFAQLLRKSLNESAISVLDFHYQLRTDLNFLRPAIGKFKSRDESFPCGIRIGKWLVLHTILRNVDLPPQDVKKIRNTFKHLRGIPFFDVPGLA